MTVFCSICRKTFDGDKNMIYDNGSDLAVLKCDTCQKRYLAIADDKLPGGMLLMGLTSTKSYISDKQKTKIITPAQQRLIVTPSEAMAEARQRRK